MTRGDTRRELAAAAPALCPTTVTSDALPLKYFIFSLTQFNPNIISNIPAFPGISSTSSERKPAMLNIKEIIFIITASIDFF